MVSRYCLLGVMMGAALVVGCDSEDPAPAPAEDVFEIVVPDNGPEPDVPQSDDAGEDTAVEPDTFVERTPGPVDSAWPMYGRTYQNTYDSDFVGSRLATLNWTVEVGSKIGGPPVITADGDIVFGARDNNLYVYDTTGQQKLVYSADEPIDSTPAVGIDGAIYFGAFDGKLYVIEPNGLLRWTFETGGAINAAPILTDDGAVLFGSRDGSLYSVSLYGDENWRFTTDGPIDGTVAVGPTGTIYLTSNDRRVYALDPATGDEQWRFETEGEIVAAPTVLEDGTIVVGSKFGLLANLFALNPDGSVKWQKRLEGGIEAPAAVGPTGTLYVGTLDGDVFSVNPDDGTVNWSTPTGAAIQGAPLVGAIGVVFVGSFDTLFYALEPSNGDIRWSLETGGLIWNGAILTANGTLLVTSDNTLLSIGGGGDCEGTPQDCSDGDVCTNDRCDDTLGCVNDPLCDDGNACTTDTCDGSGGCVYQPAGEGDACDDGFTCTSGETCQSGACTPAVNECGPAESPWPMRGKDARRTGRVEWPAAQSGSLAWSVELGRPVSSSPVLGKDGTVYVSLSNTPQDEKGAVVAVKDGTVVFDTVLPDQVTSSPAVTEFGTVYVGCKDTFFYALESDGDILWQYKSGWVRSSPVLDEEGRIYVGSESAQVHAIDPGGHEVWVFTTDDKVASSPALGADGTVYAASALGTVYAINPDGTEKWTFDAGFKIDLSSPVVGDDGAIYIGSFDKQLYAINADGTKRWSFNTNGAVDSTPALRPGGGVTFGSQDGYVYAVSANGNLDWSYQTAGSAPVLSPVTVDAQDTAYFGTLGDAVFGFYAVADGLTKWTDKIPEGVFSGAAVDDMGRVYIATVSGALKVYGGEGTCEGMDAPTCTDGDECTVDTCVEGVDGQPGGCVFEPLCDDGNPCTQDLCNNTGACFTVPAAPGTPCDDGLACTLEETCLAGSCVPTTTECSASEVSVWPMRSQNAQRTAETALVGPQSSNVLWSYNTGAEIGRGGPAMTDDGSLVIGNKGGVVTSVNTSGQLNWTYVTASPVETTPVIGAEGTIYVGDDSGTITALYPDGNLLWNLGGYGTLRSSPVLGPKGTVLFGANDGELHAVTPAGTADWDFVAGTQVQGSIALSPDNTSAYVGAFGGPPTTPGGDAVTDGGALSSVSLITGQANWTQTFPSAVAASPVVDSSGNVYVVAGTSVYGYDTSGTSTWTGSLDSFVLGGDLALTADNALLISQNAAPGQPPFLARIAIGSEAPADTAGAGALILGSPVVDSEGTVYFSTADQNVYAYSYADGVGFNNIWGVVFPDQVPSSMAIGPNGTLYFGCKDGKLYAISP